MAFLEEIITRKKMELRKKQKRLPLDTLLSRVTELEKARPFSPALIKNIETPVIAEIKRASPVKGLLRSAFDPVELANYYTEGGAAALSVITEKEFFCGDPGYIAAVKKATDLPVLRKDFIFSSYQVYESRFIGADAILLITALLSSEKLSLLLKLTAETGMEALVEIHNRFELEQALKAGAKIIGINNRDLKTFRVSLSTTLELAPQVPAGIPVISESGITSREEIIRLEEAGVNAFLIGETLVRSGDPCLTLAGLTGRTQEMEN
ncbi:MAG TPA: indole-3-glycerol phosphate synthase TrpC [Firmicutes bacterium]|nr:indole-3-glycerol phosphate synthase TrpC [Bacillota bacterium]